MNETHVTENATSSSHKRPFAERFHSPLTAWVVLGVSLLLTLTAYLVSRELVEKRLHEQFNFRANEISRAIEDRLHVYEQILWGGVALFYSSEEFNVNRKQWAAFVEALNIDKHWPGIQGMGYSVPVSPESKNLHSIQIRNEGFPDYQIKPSGERDNYSAIIYLEPFDWRNKRAFGYDMWSNAMRRAAMTRARDEGVAATSGVITLVQETKEQVQRGFLTYVPVYQGGKIPESLSERKAAFQGWVYAPFRADNLMEGILGSKDTDIVFDIYDGEINDPKSLLYNSPRQSRQNGPSVFSASHSLTLQGRPWTIEYSTPRNFTLGEESSLPQFVALIGLAIDILLFYVILSLHYIGRRTKALAENMTIELKTAKESLEDEVKDRTAQLQDAQDTLEQKIRLRTQELQEKVYEMEKMNQLTTGREMRVIELKQEINELSIALQRPPPYSSIAIESKNER